MTVRLFLDVLRGQFDDIENKFLSACDVLLLADKYGVPIVTGFVARLLAAHVDYPAARRVFCVAAMLDLENLADTAASILVEQQDRHRLSSEWATQLRQ